MKKVIIYFLLLVALPTSLLAQVTKTVGSGGDYSRLYSAFAAINNGTLTGNITLQIINNTTEVGAQPPVLHESGYNGTASYTSVTIYPTVSGKSISGSIAGALIELHGADNVTFDGRLNQTGSADLIIINTNTGSSSTTIRFIDDASSNTVRYCIVKGSETGVASGVISFSTTTLASGNDNNTIDNCNITCAFTTGPVYNRPVNAVYSSGTSGKENSGNIISNNNFYDFLSKGTTSNGIFLSSNTTTWTISGNSFYETASFTPTADVAYNAILIDNTSGTGFIISGNYIGGSSASCGGSAWTKTVDFDNPFNAISLNVGTGTASSVQNNTIKNFNWSNSLSSSWTGILIAGGDVNAGTSLGNTIGAGTGTGSITITNAQPGSFSYGINITGTGSIDCENNIIGSVTTTNDNANANDFYGINKDAGSGTTTISNNTIGSTSTANSITASSFSMSDVQRIYGISNLGTGNITIANNIIANLTNGTTNTNTGDAGLINGIRSTSGTNSITDNTIRDLTIANANASTSNTASVCGIALSGATLKTVHANIIYNLSNTFSSFTGSVTGLYFMGNTGANVVEENFIHSLSVTGTSSTTANIYGIQIASGATTYSNNIISLGGATQTTIYGIYETGAAGNNNNIYFNTVYIAGSGTSNNSYALYSAGTLNARNFRNNIFVNTRTGGSNLHYTANITAPSGGSLVCDYNDYWASGSGTILGYYGGNITTLAAWKIATGQDAASKSIDPLFISPGTSASSYLPTAGGLIAVAGTGILSDYNESLRSVLTMGAFEIGCANPVSGGTITADQTGCTPFDPAAFNSTALPLGHTGTLEYKWQYSTDGAIYSDLSPNNAPTYDPGSLILSTWFKRLARVSCAADWSGAVESNAVKVTLNPLPTASAITGLTSVCIGGTLSLTSNASGTPGPYSYTWASSAGGIASVNNSGLVTSASVGSTNITYTVTDGNTCKATSPDFAVTVKALPSTGLAVGGAGTICSGTSTNITVALSVVGVDYQLRNDNANELVGTAVTGNGGTILLSTLNLTTNTIFNVLATNLSTTCSAKLTQTALVSIDPPSAGGSISGTSSITYGSSTGTMTLGSYTGIIQRWEKRYNSGTWTSIANTIATYSETPPSAGTWGYRAVVKSGSCGEANSAEFSVTVNTKALTITANNQTKIYGTTFTFAGTEFSSTGLINSDVVSTVTLTSAGAAATATVAGSPHAITPGAAVGTGLGNYSITYANGAFTVTAKSLTITANNKSKTYGTALSGGAGITAFTSVGLQNSETIGSVTVAYGTGAAATDVTGTYTGSVTASAATGGTFTPGNYSISYTAGDIIVSAAPLTISANNQTKIYGTTFTFAGTEFSTTGLVNGDVVSTVTLTSAGAVATATVAGSTYPITPAAATGTGLGNYTITYTNGLFTVTTKALTVTANNQTKTYGTAFTFAGTEFSSTGLINSDIVSTVTLTSAGAAATATVAGSPHVITPGAAVGTGLGNYSITYTNGAFTVTAKALTITANNKNKTYGTALTGGSGITAFTSVGLQNSETIGSVTIAYGTGAAATVAVGTYTGSVTASAATGGTFTPGNYTISYTAGDIIIGATTLTISANNQTKTYGTTFTFAGTEFSATGLLNSDAVSSVTLTSAAAAATATVAGSTYAITPGAATGTGLGNYTITYTNGLFTVTTKALTVTANNQTKTYGTAFTFAGTEFSTAGLVNSDAVSSVTLTSTGAAATATVAGSPHAITPGAAVGTGLGNYSITYTNGAFTVTAKALTITAVNKNKNYGAALPVLTVSYSGLVNGDLATATLATISTTATAASPAGTYPITASAAADPNYTISYVAGILTVDKVALTISAVNKNKNYGAALPVLTITYSGLVNGDIAPATLPGISTTATSASPAGTYPITAAGAADPNYNISYVAGTLTVDKVALTITADDKSKNYGAANPALTISYTGFVNSDNSSAITIPTISTTSVPGSNTGPYPITLSGGSAANYTITLVQGIMTVNKAALTFTADNKTRGYLAANPALTYTIAGLLNGDPQTVLDVLPTIQTTALQSSNAGSYPITLTGGSDNNYNYIYVSGTLSVTKISQTITFTDSPLRLLVGDSYVLVAASTSGLTVQFESMDTELATISGTDLTGVTKGNAHIRAYNTGDQNYNAAEVLATVEIFSTHKDIVHLFTPNNDGINDHWELPELATWGKCDVKVYNRWGKLVFADADYNNLWDGTSNGSPLPEGPYYFVIKTENAGVVKGTVNIVR